MNAHLSHQHPAKSCCTPSAAVDPKSATTPSSATIPAAAASSCCGSKPAAVVGDSAIDPVCGMAVDPMTAKHRAEHGAGRLKPYMPMKQQTVAIAVDLLGLRTIPQAHEARRVLEDHGDDHSLGCAMRSDRVVLTQGR